MTTETLNSKPVEPGDVIAQSVARFLDLNNLAPGLSKDDECLFLTEAAPLTLSPVQPACTSQAIGDLIPKRHDRRNIVAVAVACCLSLGLDIATYNHPSKTSPSFVFNGDEVVNPGGAPLQAKFVAGAIKAGARKNGAYNNQVVVIGDEVTDVMSQIGGFKQDLRAEKLNPTDIQTTTEAIQPSPAQKKIDAHDIQTAGTVMLEFGTGTMSGDNQTTAAKNIAAIVANIRTINPRANIEVMNTYAVGSAAPTAKATNAAIAQDAKKLNYYVIDWNHEVLTAPPVPVSGLPQAKHLIAKSNSPSVTSAGDTPLPGKTPEVQLAQLRQRIVDVANTQLKQWSSQPGYPWTSNNSYAENAYKTYSDGRTEYWCADFVSWVYWQAGHPFTFAPPYWQTPWDQISVRQIANSAKADGRNFTFHQAAGYMPQPADLAIHGNSYYHINMVTAVNGNVLTLVGGDQSNASGTDNTNYPGGSIVSKYQDHVGDPDIIGYVSPVIPHS